MQAMTERMHDIRIYKDMLRSQLKAAETERQTHRWVGKWVGWGNTEIVMTLTCISEILALKLKHSSQNLNYDHRAGTSGVP